MTLLRRRARSRSCWIHGDNGCEIQGEAGPRDRAQDTRLWRADIVDDVRTVTSYDTADLACGYDPGADRHSPGG